MKGRQVDDVAFVTCTTTCAIPPSSNRAAGGCPAERRHDVGKVAPLIMHRRRLPRTNIFPAQRWSGPVMRTFPSYHNVAGSSKIRLAISAMYRAGRLCVVRRPVDAARINAAYASAPAIRTLYQALMEAPAQVSTARMSGRFEKRCRRSSPTTHRFPAGEARRASASSGKSTLNTPLEIN